MGGGFDGRTFGIIMSNNRQTLSTVINFNWANSTQTQRIQVWYDVIGMIIITIKSVCISHYLKLEKDNTKGKINILLENYLKHQLTFSIVTDKMDKFYTNCPMSK